MQDYSDNDINNAILLHAKEEYPKECCGLIIKNIGYVKCNNVHENPLASFTIDPKDYMKAVGMGEIQYIVHSHPDLSSAPSDYDIASCNKHQIPWIIISYPSGNISTIQPQNKIIPLEGRKFVHGIQDCYTLIKDYYSQVLNIELMDHERKDNWWHDGLDLYTEFYEEAGFYKVTDIQKNDVIIMQMMSNIPNHGGIYIGDEKILHHLTNRVSRVEMYTGYWIRNTRYILRNKEYVNRN